ncbi:MAG TPA: DinB family protein [Dehalococcoidia bacterium]|nr:DinB family protein [Dehalococcoidia bacterium]
MFKDIDGYLRYYRGLHKRTLRDVGALPPEAETYKPATEEGENSWSIAEIVRHMAGSRLYFARAYNSEGWYFEDDVRDCAKRVDWLPALEESFELFTQRLEGTPPEWLERKIKMIDTDGELSGWRILMMCLEHEVHHRSQVDTYAGLHAWEVPHIYGRSAEHIGTLREEQTAQKGGD